MRRRTHRSADSSGVWLSGKHAIYISTLLSKTSPNCSSIFSFHLKSQLPVCDDPLASFPIPFKESRASKTSCYNRLHILYRHQATTRFFFWQWKTQFFKKQLSFIHHLHKNLLFVLWCMLESILYIPRQPTYVVVFNGVLRFLSPPSYSIGTVLDNVNDTMNKKIK